MEQVLDTQLIEDHSTPITKIELTVPKRTVGELLDSVGLDPKHIIVFADGLRMQLTDEVFKEQDIVVMRLVAGG